MSKYLINALSALAVLIMVVLGMALVGITIDGMNRHSQEHDICLTGARNGLDIRRCEHE
jgi:hypothetical protein